MTSISHEQYTVSTPIYEGPLDLLLDLIERAELDITTLALAHVTDQYLLHLGLLEDRNAAEVSSFLVVAARLIQIKSEALLPRPPIRTPGEEDPGESLAEQLKIYRRYKRLGEWFNQRESIGLKTYLHPAQEFEVEGKLDLTGITVSDLTIAALALTSRRRDVITINEVITIPLLTIRERIQTILKRVRRMKVVSFNELTSRSSQRIEVIVTFLAILELVKRHLLIATQPSLFADIQFEAESNWEEEDEFELEY